MEIKPKTIFADIDEYHAQFTGIVREMLDEMRKTISQAAPQAKEVISYNMPGFKLNGVLVWYAAGKEHIGFYPTPLPIVVFKDELSAYKTSKGAIQFPLDKPIPKALVKKIVKMRVEDDMEKAKEKKEKSKKPARIGRVRSGGKK